MSRTSTIPRLSEENLVISGPRRVNILKFSPNGELLATSDGAGNLYIYNVNNTKLMRQYEGSNDIRCFAWHPALAYVLVVGFVNGDVIQLTVPTIDVRRDVVKLWQFPGCIHVVAFKGDASQIAIAFDKGVSVISKPDEASNETQALDIPNAEGAVPGVRGVHYTPVGSGRILVCFLDPRLGIAMYSCVRPYKLLKRFEMRDNIKTLTAGSALSPSGARLAIVNMTDGIDWYDVKTRTLLGSTKYRVGEKRIVDVEFVGEDSVVAGHSEGFLVLASSRMAKNPEIYKFLKKAGRTQFLAVGYFRGNLHVAAASTIRNNIETRSGEGTNFHPITIIAAASGGRKNSTEMIFLIEREKTSKTSNSLDLESVNQNVEFKAEKQEEEQSESPRAETPEVPSSRYERSKALLRRWSPSVKYTSVFVVLGAFLLYGSRGETDERYDVVLPLPVATTTITSVENVTVTETRVRTLPGSVIFITYTETETRTTTTTVPGPRNVETVTVVRTNISPTTVAWAPAALETTGDLDMSANDVDKKSPDPAVVTDLDEGARDDIRTTCPNPAVGMSDDVETGINPITSQEVVEYGLNHVVGRL